MFPPSSLEYRHQLQKNIYLNRLRQQEKMFKDIQDNKRYHQDALETFPFGKESIKLSNYVSQQLNSKENQQNIRILQQFRRKAVQDKFHSRTRNPRQIHRFITQNMLPGITNNPSMANSFSPELNPSQSQVHQNFSISYPVQRFETVDVGSLYNQRRPSPLVTQPQYSYSSSHQQFQNPEHQNLNNQTISQGSLQPSLQKQKIYQKYYKLKIKSKRKQLKKMQRLEELLKQMNKKIANNSVALQNALTPPASKHKIIVEETPPRRSNGLDWSRAGQVTDTPSSAGSPPQVRYTRRFARQNNIFADGPKQMSGSDRIKQHLLLLKKHSERLQTLHNDGL